jgi:2-oxo-4-hydroxy-4-carboxy-5-ureidoimidazoline decarboxylase
MPTTSLWLLNESDRAGFVAALGSLFESSPWVADAAYAKRPFRDREHLLKELCLAMRMAPPERQLELIRAHPDLAGRMARAAELTAESRREQASAGLDEMPAAAAGELAELNEAYRRRFGFPFVICARLNDWKSILESLRQRLACGKAEERETALHEIEKIAKLRLDDTVDE